MKKSALHFALSAVLVLIHVENAISQDLATLKNTLVRQLTSTHVGGMTYKLNVTLPPDYERTQSNYPVLYYLDAWMTTGIMSNSYFIASFSGAIEPLILVGVSFDSDASGFLFNRARDYTPTYVAPEKLGEIARMVPASGGGPAFLDFLKLELFPFVEKNYRANPQDRGILGYSLGGLFGAWALIKDPSLFRRYALCSPSLQWDNFMILKEWEKLSPKSDKVVIISQTGGEDPAIKSGIKKMVALASGVANVNISSFEVPDETHHTGVPASHMKALTLLYPRTAP